jgi:uroporphyrinogen-III synthase
MTSDKSVPVVVTRPLAQALSFADKVRAAGRVAVVFPLLAIEPLEDQSRLRNCLEDLARYAMVAFVSPNAIDAALPLVSAWPREVALAVVGAGSRQALARHGLTDANVRIFSPLDPNRSDSETLLAALDLDQVRGKRILIVRGETGRELMGDALRAAGAEVDQVAAYRRVAPSLDGPLRVQLGQLLDDGADWVITSSEALGVLKDMASRLGGEAALTKVRQQRMIVPHARIAETAHALGFLNVVLTASGDERLLAELQSRP